MGKKMTGAGCEVCNDEEPVRDDVNKDVSYIIRGDIQYILEDLEGDFPRCSTIGSFKISHCPNCGKKLQGSRSES